MAEHHEHQFRGVWIPADVMAKAAAGEINAGDMLLLAIIDSLVAPDKGCYASNTYLANRTGRSERRVRVSISKLKDMGLLKQVGFDGKRRYLETAWSRVEVGRSTGQDRPETAGQSGRKRPGSYNSINNKAISEPAASEGAGGFGLVEPSGIPPTDFDVGIATELLDAARRHLGPAHKYVRRAKLSSWADHVRLLRTTDKVDERRISRVMDWYRKAIGGEFVPQVFSGEAFRQKFDRLEAAAKRDILNTATVGPEATKVATRLQALGWPKGSAEAIPAACQACWDAYAAWLAEVATYTAHLQQSPQAADKRLHRLAVHIGRKLPAPAHFVEQWMRAVNARVQAWDGWSGELAPYIFKPEAKRFQAMGRGWATEYCNDPDRWDKFIEAMQGCTV